MERVEEREGEYQYMVHVSEKIFALVVQNGARGSFKALQLSSFVSFPFGATSFPLLAFARGEQME